jgi:valyl-tRNA synthetase
MALRPQAHEIIRTWAFYTIVKALHHEQTVPWRTIAISGWCLASDGSKMSKSRGNVVDPIRLLDEYGSDVVRYWTGTSRLGNDTVLSLNTLKQGKRLVTKLWNAARLAHLALEQAEIEPATARADVANGIICHPLDQWLLSQLSSTVAGATEAFEAYEYSRALRITEDFFWRTHCDNYLEIVKARTRFEGEPSAEQRSALHTLHHATRAIIRLFAPFMPYVTDSLERLLGGADSAGPNVHARGQWPSAEDQVDPLLNHELGDSFVEVVAAARKVKSDLAVSLRAPVTTVTISPAEGHGLEEIDALLARVGEDLKTILSAEAVTAARDCPEGLPASLSPNRHFHVALAMAPAAPSA